MAIKILIADDHALLRQGIKRVLNFEDGFEVIGEAEDGQEAVARTLMLQPDVLLLDINMPGLSGLEVVKQLKQADCETRVIALTIHDSDNYVLEMLKNGALGYLLKDVEPAVLIKAIHVVNGGDAFVYPELAERLFGSATVTDDVESRAKEMLDESRGERLTSRVFANADGSVRVGLTTARDMPHGAIADEARAAWAFMSRFTRPEGSHTVEEVRA